jgi:hypothetical protein
MPTRTASTFVAPVANRATSRRGVNRLASLEGVTLGLLCNSKPNAQLLLDTVAEEIGARVELAGIVRDAKAHPSSGAPEHVYSNLAERCGAVIFASAT